VVQSFVHLRLLTDLNVKASTDSVENLRYKKKDRIHRTKKERKNLKERKLMEKEMAEADAIISVEEHERLQSEAIKIVFSLYFRILKATRSDAMMAVVLDGIARFARLINADFFGDLLEVLREILEGWDDDDGSRTRAQLVCINTAFTLLANQDGSTMELSYFVEQFYKVLPALSLSTSLSERPSTEEKSLLELVVRVVDAVVFSAPIPPSPTTIFTLYKRLLTCTLHLEEAEATTILKILHRMGARYDKKLERLWDREGARAAGGKSVSGWELALLKHHYCTSIRESSLSLKSLGKDPEQ
jgi:nucleolar complex protein 3